jgi:hypothetical protein
MKTLLKLEELVQFLGCLFVLIVLDVEWWVYVLLAIGPDISMLGYLVGPRFGAACYNLFHHKGLALVVLVLGVVLTPIYDIQTVVQEAGRNAPVWIAGILLYGHACLDRMLGYGLKFSDAFHHTHLGWIGKGVPNAK